MQKGCASTKAKALHKGCASMHQSLAQAVASVHTATPIFLHTWVGKKKCYSTWPGTAAKPRTTCCVSNAKCNLNNFACLVSLLGSSYQRAKVFSSTNKSQGLSLVEGLWMVSSPSPSPDYTPTPPQSPKRSRSKGNSQARPMPQWESWSDDGWEKGWDDGWGEWETCGGEEKKWKDEGWKGWRDEEWKNGWRRRDESGRSLTSGSAKQTKAGSCEGSPRGAPK